MTAYNPVVPGINQRILLNVADQKLRFELPGIPATGSTISVTVYDPRYDLDDTNKNPIVTGSATRSLSSVTLTAAAGPSQSDPRWIACVPGTYEGVLVGDPVWLENAYHQRERAIVAKYSAAGIGVSDPLVWEYAIGDKIQSAVALSPALPTAWVSDEDNLGQDFMAEWTYTIDSITSKVRTRWDLTREIQDSRIQDSVLFERNPDLVNFRWKSNPEAYSQIIKAAQRDVDALCWRIGVNPNLIRSNERLQYLVESRAHVLLAEAGQRPGGRDLEEYVKQKRDEWDDLSSTITEGYFRIPYDADDDDKTEDEAIMSVGFVR